MTQVNKWLKVLVASSIAMGSYSCSESKTVEEYQAEAKKFIEQNDHNSAIIALKNANAVDLQNANLRFQLGSAYLNQGDYLSAEKEIELAKTYGFDEVQIFPKLVEIKFKLDKFDEVYQLADAAQALPDESYIPVLIYAGISSLYQGNREQAQVYIDNANQISSESVYGQIGQAYLAQTAEEAENALKMVDTLIAYAPDVTETYLLKAYLLQGAQQNSAAAVAFEEYSKLRPKEYQIKFFIAQNYIAARQLDKAEPVVNQLLKISEQHPLTNQMKAQLEFDKKNFQVAKEYGIKAYQLNDKFPLATIIAGMSSYYLGDYEQAYRDLVKVKTIVTPDHIVNKVLVELQLRLGYDNDALTSINQLVKTGNANPSLLTAASKELFEAGDKEAAQELLSQSIKLNSDNPEDVINQGIMKIRLNELGTGIEILEKAVQLEPDSAKAEMGLAMGYFTNQQYDEALVIAKKWQTTSDKKIQGLLLEAEISEKQENPTKAKELLKAIIAIDENNVPALFKLALYAHKENELDQAFNYYTQVLSVNTEHVRSIVNLTQLVLSNKTYTEQATAFYQGKITKNTSDLYAKLGLAYIYKLDGKPLEEIKLYQEIMTFEPSIEGIEVVLGDAYLSINDVAKAIKTYQEFLNKKPGNLLVGHRLLRVYEQTAQYDLALSLINSLISDNKGNDNLLLMKVYFQSKLKIDIAAADLKKLTASEKLSNSSVLNKALGNQHYNNKEFDKAVTQYQLAFDKAPNRQNVIDLSKAIHLTGDIAKSVTTLESYLKTTPDDSPVQAMLAGAYLNSANKTKALELYRQVIKKDPNNVLVLNNLAFLEIEQGDLKAGLTYAQKAVEVAPNVPEIMDTYAQALVANNQIAEGIKIFDEALLLKKGNVEISLNKAKALISNNQVSQAKSLLNALTGATASEQKQINQLLNSL